MKPINLVVTEQHRSEYPKPISFVERTPLCIGEKYSGCEGWDEQMGSQAGYQMD